MNDEYRIMNTAQRYGCNQIGGDEWQVATDGQEESSRGEEARGLCYRKTLLFIIQHSSFDVPPATSH